MDEDTKSPAAIAKPARARRTSPLGWVICLLLLAALVLLRQGFVFFLFAMLPSLAAFMTDRDPARRNFKVIGACNLAGALPYLASLSKQEQSLQALQGALSDAHVWLVIYAAAGFGWLLNWLAPYVAQLFIEVHSTSEINHCRKAQAKLIEEWGSNIHHPSGSGPSS